MSGPCERPECGGVVRTDSWGTPVLCPHQDTSATTRQKPRASVIELIATDHQRSEDGAGSIVLPREVRINGVSVYTAKGCPIRISEITSDNLVTVNLTLIVGRLTVAADSDLPETP
ncbi:hypothetical protein [Streptomyces sp. NPDC085596]|uniref:hypothetical protein n=1 Tax=Streptomyces sp. NPDC085596 TaxID=3365731 RepID=UPI0037D2FD63